MEQNNKEDDDDDDDLFDFREDSRIVLSCSNFRDPNTKLFRILFMSLSLLLSLSSLGFGDCGCLRCCC